jgi:hypothetical protein
VKQPGTCHVCRLKSRWIFSPGLIGWVGWQQKPTSLQRQNLRRLALPIHLPHTTCGAHLIATPKRVSKHGHLDLHRYKRQLRCIAEIAL